MKRILDSIDQKILNELALNARQSHANLAEKVNLSRNAVRQRIERMERDNIIQGYTIVSSEAQNNVASHINAIIFVYRYDRMRDTDVIDSLMNIPEVKKCEVMSGELDLLVRVSALNSEHIDRVWNEISLMSGIQNTVTSFVLSSFNDPL